MLRSLAFMHSLQLIHCDLKPENLMIADFSEPGVKIIDLGSSCFVHDRLTAYVQSRAYRAPEVVIRTRYDAKIDVWSLGCILAEILMGSVLFQVCMASSRRSLICALTCRHLCATELRQGSLIGHQSF